MLTLSSRCLRENRGSGAGRRTAGAEPFARRRSSDLNLEAGAQIKILIRSRSYGYLRGSSGFGSHPRY